MTTHLPARPLLTVAPLILTFTLAAVPPAAAEQPTIAVLPFANLSGDAAQDYLSDVVNHNTIKTLSRVDGLLVVASDSAAAGQDKPLPEIAKELDVRYVLQGGVQQSGDRVHMTATLSDAASDKTLWSEDYERELTAVFDLQDEITRRVVKSLGVQLTPEQQQRVWHRQTDDLEAYRAALQCLEHHLRFTKSDNAEAQKLCEKALALDSDFALAWVLLGHIHNTAAIYQWVDDSAAARARAAQAAQKALASDESSPNALMLLAYVKESQGDPRESVALAEKAAAFAPSDADINADLAALLILVAAKPKEGLESITKAVRLNRAHPWFPEVVGLANYSLGDYDKALAAFQEYHKRSPDDTDGYVEIIYTSATMGRLEDAKALVAELLGKHPDFTIEGYTSIHRFKDPAVVKLIRDNTAKAGLPQ
jgi:adenylate cyclase